MTWVPLATAGALYATKADERITDYIIQNPIANEDNDDLVRDLNGITTYTTALLVPDDEWSTKAKRVVVEFSAFEVSKQAVVFLNENVPKETPNTYSMDALGSHHTLGPFTGSAMTRRNVAQMPIPNWAGYSIVGTSYFFATSSTLSRIQDGGHSFADQLISVT